MLLRILLAPVLLAALASCGGDAKKPATSAADEPTETKSGGDAVSTSEGDGNDGEEIVAAKSGGIPSECATHSDDICLPPKKLVKKLCNGDYRTVALALFSEGTPWKRGYLTRPMKAWSASGSSSREKLSRDEEVLVLIHRSASNTGGMQVSGATGGYEVMRWDSMCVTLDQGDLRFEPPRKIHNARIIWATLERAARDVLKKDEAVRPVFLRHRKECRGVTVGDVTKKCEKVDAELSRAIAEYVRSKGGLPAPFKLPK